MQVQASVPGRSLVQHILKECLYLRVRSNVTTNSHIYNGLRKRGLSERNIAKLFAGISRRVEKTTLTANCNSSSCVSLVHVNWWVLFLCREQLLMYEEFGWYKSRYGIFLLYPLASGRAEWMEWGLNILCQPLNSGIHKYDFVFIGDSHITWMWV